MFRNIISWRLRLFNSEIKYANFSQGQRSLREKEYLCTDWSVFLLIDDVIAYPRAHWLMKDRTKSASGGSEQWFRKTFFRWGPFRNGELKKKNCTRSTLSNISGGQWYGSLWTECVVLPSTLSLKIIVNRKCDKQFLYVLQIHLTLKSSKSF